MDERLNRCQWVAGRWVYSLVCEPAYRPMRWLVSQGTPWPLSARLLWSLLLPRTRGALFCFQEESGLVCRFASSAIIVTVGFPVSARYTELFLPAAGSRAIQRPMPVLAIERSRPDRSSSAEDPPRTSPAPSLIVAPSRVDLAPTSFERRSTSAQRHRR